MKRGQCKLSKVLMNSSIEASNSAYIYIYIYIYILLNMIPCVFTKTCSVEGKSALLARIRCHNRLKKRHDAFPSRIEGNGHTEGLDIIKELLQGIRPSQDSEVMIYGLPDVGDLSDALAVPSTVDGRPDLTGSRISFFDGHTVPAGVSAAFYPGIFVFREWAPLSMDIPPLSRPNR